MQSCEKIKCKLPNSDMVAYRCRKFEIDEELMCSDLLCLCVFYKIWCSVKIWSVVDLSGLKQVSNKHIQF